MLNRPIRGEEIWVERPDGQRIWVAPFPTPLRDEAGTLVGAVNVLVDITARKEAEQEIKLRREEAEAHSQHLAAMFDSAVAGIAEFTGDGHLIAVNDRYCKMVGRTRDELLNGMTCVEITHPDDQEMARAALQTLVDGEPSFILEKRYVRPDGEIVWVHKSVSAIRREGLLKSSVAIVTDVTERKRVEDELRTASELKDQFLGLVSHELRTPTSTVVANALILLRRGDQLAEDDRQQALEDIASEGTKLQRVIENLLLLTRLDVAGEPVAEQVALEKMLAERVEVFLRRRPARTVSLEFDDALPAVHGQEALLAMVVDNVLSNADKYSPADTEIEVTARTRVDGLVEFRIGDRGIGIDPGEMPQLFVPFFRTANARGYASGMGLGLAVCRRILDAYGGTICAEGRREGGTDFILTLQTSASEAATARER
jgi:PAS domain S-box-containing protein